MKNSEDDFVGFIYKITNISNNKVYVGQTSRSVNVRWKEHLRHSDEINTHNRYFANAISKYGVDSFVVETIEECDNKILDERECFWIKYYNSNNRDCGYNLTVGGNGSRILDYEKIYSLWDNGMGTGEIAKRLGISQSNLINILHGHDGYSSEEGLARGYNHVRKTKGNAVAQYTLSGDFVQSFESSKEASRKISKSSHHNIFKCCKERKGLSGGYQWRFLDDEPPGEYKGKVSGYSRQVAQYDLDGNLICIFNSISEAGRATSTNQSSISHCCLGRFKSANNFKWSYIM